MLSGASYNQVAGSGIIHVTDLAEDLAASPAVQYEFREELTNLARNMAKTKIKGKGGVNKPLMTELMTAFRAVECAVLLTQDQITTRGEQEKHLVFLLCHPGVPPAATPAVAKPHKGKLILFAGEDNQLYIPVPVSHNAQSATLIPFPLTAENVETIGGHIGKSLRDAFKLGVKDLTLHKTTKPRIQREKDQEIIAREEIAEQIRCVKHHCCEV